MVAKTEVSNKVDIAPFELTLPDTLQVKPFAEIDLPKNKKAVIYKLMTTPTHKEDVSHLRYDLYLISKKTGAAVGFNDRFYRHANFTDIPSIYHWLHDAAVSLSIKKRTRKEVAEGDEDEE